MAAAASTVVAATEGAKGAIMDVTAVAVATAAGAAVAGRPTNPALSKATLSAGCIYIFI